MLLSVVVPDQINLLIMSLSKVTLGRCWMNAYMLWIAGVMILTKELDRFGLETYLCPILSINKH
jgi:hypothetical protein